WVFLDGASPDIPSQPAVRLRGAVLTGAVMGLLFLLLIELLYFKKYLPTVIGHGISSAYNWDAAFSTHVFGHRSFVLTLPAIALQVLAAAIVAARRQRLRAVCGLFAASVAGFIIVAGNHLFFFIGYEYQTSEQLVVAAIFMGLGSVAAVPAV